MALVIAITVECFRNDGNNFCCYRNFILRSYVEIFVDILAGNSSFYSCFKERRVKIGRGFGVPEPRGKGKIGKIEGCDRLANPHGGMRFPAGLGSG
jgi:hypothetical protein